MICNQREYIFVALVNSGFETETSQLLIPAAFAREIGLWPPEQGFETTYDTAGGPAPVWVFPRRARVQVLTPTTTSREVEVDIVVSPIEREALISDKLAGALEIVVEDFARGLWRLRSETQLHETEQPQFWGS